MSTKRTDWNFAYAIVKAWRDRSDQNVSEFRCLDLNKDALNALTGTTHSGIRVYFAYDDGKYKGVAVQTVEKGGKHNDVTPGNPIEGQTPFFYLLTTPSSYGNNIMDRPIQNSPCNDYVATDDNHISWSCATNWAYQWQNKLITGADAKGTFIPKKDLVNALNEMPNESGVRIYLVLYGNDYKSVIVGVDSRGTTLAPVNLTDPTTYKAYDFSMPCPAACGSGNQLNGLG